MRFFAVAIAIVALLATGRTARAEDEPLRLTWTAPAECPSADVVRMAALQDVDAGAVHGVIEADARVEENPPPAAQRWKVILRTRRDGAVGERIIEAATCQGVADAAAVVLALALVSLRGPQVPEVPPPRAAERLPSPPPVDVQEERPHVEPSVPSKRARQIAFGASMAGDASTLPAPTIGGSLSLAWVPGRARIELDVRHWAAQSKTLDRSSAGARFSMWSWGLRGCWALLRVQAFDLSPCAGADLHRVSAPGYGAETNYDDASATWTSLTTGALARLSLLSWLSVRARVESFASLTRPTFVVEGKGALHHPPTLGVSASFGVEVLFL